MNKTVFNSLPETTEVLIVGGGIVGAGAMRDLALHGVSSTLIDARTICSQTSSKSSKMLHGGIRYLETYDFDLVKEALEEKNLWLRLAPEYCHEEMFTFPIYKDSPRPLFLLRAGLFLYDLLSHWQNSPHKVYGPKEVLASHPHLKSNGLVGAGLYADAVVDDKGLGVACVKDALLHPNQHVSENTELIELIKVGNSWKATLKLAESENYKEILAKDIIFALGPFTDKVLSSLDAIPWREVLLPSRGAHLWVDAHKLMAKTPLVLQDKGNRIVFVIPHGDKILVGTTEEEAPANFFDLQTTQNEEEYLINLVNEYYPGSKISKGDILGSFSGVRPLVREENESSRGKTARYHKVFWPYSNVSVIVGGKYTTFRRMVQDSVRQVIQKRGGVYDSNRTCQSFKS